MRRYITRGIVALVPLMLACGSSPKLAPDGSNPENPGTPKAPELPIPKDGAPPTAQQHTMDSYHSVEVHDVYRWLEQPLDSSPEVKAFVDAQNTHARRMLDKLPEREAVRARLAEILGAATIGYADVTEVKNQLFAMKLEPPKQQRMLVVMPSGARGPDQGALAKERVVVDPNALDAAGHTAIDWYRVAPNGKHVAISLSVGGSETGDVHVYEVASGKEVFEVVPGVNAGTAGGDLAWLADSSGFYYSRYPRGDERAPEDKLFYVQLYRHQLGTPTADDVYELGKELTRIAEVFIDVAPNGDALCTIQKGDGGEFELFLQLGGYKKAAPWTKIAAYEDDVVQGFFGPRDDIYLISRKGAAKGKLLRAPRKELVQPGARGTPYEVILPEGDDALVSDIWNDGALTIHGGSIYALYQLGGPSTVRVFDLDGKPKAGPDLLPVSGVADVVPVGKADVLFPQSSFLQPVGWYRYTPGKKPMTVKTALSAKSPVDLIAAGVTVTREMATSRDGTKVPVNIIVPKGFVKGTSIPFLVTGYGGYGVNIEPGFQALRSVFLDAGIGIAVINLRGGGEFGEAWHENGMLTKKQNVFDDFIGGVEHLVGAGYATPGRIGIMGGSNGGLLMGAVTTQRPELFVAVLSFVGIYDMLRFETEPNGAFNVPEFGTVTDPGQFAALYAYSPYHRVNDGQIYPPTLFIGGANDVRVAPWHSRKMVARLQAADGGASPHLLVTTFDAGHGVGGSVQQAIDQSADGYGFLIYYLKQP